MLRFGASGSHAKRIGLQLMLVDKTKRATTHANNTREISKFNASTKTGVKPSPVGCELANPRERSNLPVPGIQPGGSGGLIQMKSHVHARNTKSKLRKRQLKQHFRKV